MHTASITYDWNGPGDLAPREGEFLRAKTTGYKIVSIRQVRSEKHPSRWKIRARRVALDDVPVVAWPLVWNRRERKR